MFDKILDAILGTAESDPEANAVDLGGLEKFLAGVSFPISKKNLLKAMQANGASDAVLELVNGIDDNEFETIGDFVSGLFGGKTSTRETIRTEVNGLSSNLKDDLAKKGNIL